MIYGMQHFRMHQNAILSSQHKNKSTSCSHNQDFIPEQIIFQANPWPQPLSLLLFHKSVLQNSLSHFHNKWLFSFPCLQVNASLEEQAFTSAWGSKAKTTFLKASNLLSDSDKKLMNKIKVLGSANLPLDEREKVCFASVIPKSQIMVFILRFQLVHLSLNRNAFLFFFSSITQFLVPWRTSIPQPRCMYSQT